jgi:ABC-type glycerol-3-phosphate transport system substrate-binding protein
MKKTIATMLALILGAFAFVGCGGGEAPADDAGSDDAPLEVSDGSASEAETSDPEEAVEEEPADPFAVDVPEGKIVKNMTFEELEAALDNLNPKAGETSFADIATLLGVQGEFYDDEDEDDFERSSTWYASDDGYASFLFHLDTGLMKGGWGVQPEGRPRE